ncbi:D-alanine--D-alanine ligase family protein [Cellulomonas fimi]|uniref:D-alanine--D-alanine ligase n=1 Tax=Cellulomonas fimi (strain ATCC 484 / DSM 20113 / JCM 1341 / CCUG 24087 / LMG 16345 / NBRC 15513 / NCIMB 8980 / NCTC 7547 / NRS-133) TaxID=590998 RepID=F4H888_CELFA|nr:D-alanine--D-alanine ligase family protein [Cellulomonas fimi]AEE44645.1 D-alanine/D-alanine ligase [Cellulomonas fimi ATCC 484]NNH08990.1 D-alanine--D-alanine ligase [Cellulomonas fimi]VEH26881.1 D-alanine--D-alanine ligase [Cellulomonas fimi]
MSAGRTRVAVVGGGQSCEHEVSLASAASVVGALTDRYDVVPLTITRDGTWCDEVGRPVGLARAVQTLGTCAAVVPMVHGPRGEDGTLAALCELAGVPYVGSGVGAGALAMDKWATKLVAQAVGVATAPGRLLTAATAAAYVFEHPVVVKPVAAGSSHGVTLVRDAGGLRPALDAALRLDGRVLVEDVVEGREVDVAVLATGDGHVVAPLLEVVVDGLFDHAAKYGGTADLRVPADVPEADAQALRDAAVRVFDALGCAGVARVDFFLTADGPVLNEVNTTPGLTEHSQVPRMFAAAGLSYPDLLDRLVRDAVAGAAAAAAAGR